MARPYVLTNTGARYYGYNVGRNSPPVLPPPVGTLLYRVDEFPRMVRLRITSAPFGGSGLDRGCTYAQDEDTGKISLIRYMPNLYILDEREAWSHRLAYLRNHIPLQRHFVQQALAHVREIEERITMIEGEIEQAEQVLGGLPR
jgi:hypothetical protein